MPGKTAAPLRNLQIAAYVVIVAWGIMTASHILSIVLISLLLSYVMLPLPKWLIRRFHFGKGLAIVLTVGFVAALYTVVSVALFEASFQMRVKLPIYEQHIQTLYGQIAGFLGSHGVQTPSLTSPSFYSSERVITFMEFMIPRIIGFFSDRVLVAILSIIFLVEIAEGEDSKAGPLGRTLIYYGKEVQRFIAISAQTGAITAAANLALFFALRVDFPVVWALLYFYLHFIPNIGFIIAIVPPVLVSLLTFGWKRALIVILALGVTQILSDSILQPLFMKKGLHVTFLQSTVSLLVWGFLLGPAGAVLAIPLTIVLKKYLQNPLREGELTAELASG